MNEGNRQALAAEIREAVPAAPGCYAFVDSIGRLLYVGKSVNLRKRMGSYFRQDPVTAESHVGRLLANVGGFAWWRTPTELLALLLEDALIKLHLPPLNTRQREFRENRYLEITASEFPACVVVGHAPDFGTREVFGPLKDVHYARRLRDILHETLGIRTCRDPAPVARCLEFDLGRCSGPCRAATDRDAYAERADRARGFLLGDGEAVLERLSDARDGASERKNYEEAGRLQEAIDLGRRFLHQRRFLRTFSETDCVVRASADGLEYSFSRGSLAAPRDVIVGAGSHGTTDLGTSHPADRSRISFQPESAGRRALTALRRPVTDDRILSDRARIVCRWAERAACGPLHAP